MEIDDQVVTLCEEFADLKEPEKDYILEVSHALARLVSVKDGITRKVNDSLNTNILHTYKEYLA
jgi:hypothetical protein